MNFNWKNSAKWGAFTGFGFFMFRTFGDYMLLGNSICKEFYTINFYKPLVFHIVFWSLGGILFDWIGSLIANKKESNKKACK